MNKKYIFIIIIILILVLSLVIITKYKHNYKPFRWDGANCITYYKDCVCIGSLIIMESYPPQYRCKGLNFCKDINITECE